jgi:hypothetical protein
LCSDDGLDEEAVYGLDDSDEDEDEDESEAEDSEDALEEALLKGGKQAQCEFAKGGVNLVEMCL